MLRSVGLNLDDVTMVPAPSSTAQLLLAKKVDVTTGVSNAEQAEVDVTGKQRSTIVLGKDHGVPNSYVFVLAMNDGFRRDQPEVAKKFMDVVARRIAEARANPDEAVDVLLKRYPDAGSRAYIAAAWKAMQKDD